MSEGERKISIRQLSIIFLVLIASPIIRVIPKLTAEDAKQASWVTPIISVIPFLILLYILNELMTKSKEVSLDDVYIKILGKHIGKTVLFIYIIWIFLVTSLYVRYFADRFTISIYIFAPIQFFMITLLLFVYVVCRNRLEYFARLVEVFFIVLAIFFLGSIIIAIPNIKISNIFPVTTYDVLPVLKSSFSLISLWGYITYLFFLSDKVSNTADFKKYFGKITIVLVIGSIIVTLITVGIFGAQLTKDLVLPFFTFFKNIQILDVIERVEAILISLWLVTDFVIVATFIFINARLIRKTFNLTSSKEMVTPIIFIVFILSQYLSENIFEILSFSKYLFFNISIVFTIVIPIIVLIVGKIRKLL